MIPVPKPKFFDRKIPAGMSKDDYLDEIYLRQTHVLRDAIDRVSFIYKPYPPLPVYSTECFISNLN